MIDALIFDFDGLIIDTETPDFQTWQEIYREHGAELDFAVWSQYIGGAAARFDPYEYLETLIGRPIDRAAVQQRYRVRVRGRIAEQPILPGVQEYIGEAKRLGLRLGLASSSTREWVEGNLSRLGLLHEFHCVRCSDDVSRVKPDPELYRAVLTHLNVSSHRAVALEDSPNGIRAAKDAGLFCVAIPNPLTIQLPLDHADLRVESLAVLPLARLLEIVGRKT